MTLVGAQASSGSISPSNLVTTSLSYEWEVSGSWDSTRDLLAREPYFSAGEHFQEDQATLMVLYCTVLYCTVLYCTVLYCTVMYRFHYLRPP